jgi:hypothetical protein
MWLIQGILILCTYAAYFVMRKLVQLRKGSGTL